MLVVRRVSKAPCECLSDGANLNVSNLFCFQGSDWLVQAVPTKPLPSWWSQWQGHQLKLAIAPFPNPPRMPAKWFPGEQDSQRLLWVRKAPFLWTAAKQVWIQEPDGCSGSVVQLGIFFAKPTCRVKFRAWGNDLILKKNAKYIILCSPSQS